LTIETHNCIYFTKQYVDLAFEKKLNSSIK